MEIILPVDHSHGSTLHNVKLLVLDTLVAAEVRLFSKFGMPSYRAIVGNEYKPRSLTSAKKSEAAKQ